MKFFLVFISALFFAQNCEAQSRLPAQMPEKVTIGFKRDGAMSRSYRRVRIENDRLEFEESEGKQTPQKWSSAVSRRDLAALYQVFVENKFDTIKNDERKRVVYDAGSENIAISADVNIYLAVTYGKNSPLSGENLRRYQSVRKALDDFIARHEKGKTGNSSSVVNQTSFEAAQERIQGVWRAEGKSGRNSWYLEWTFDKGNFKQKGYPPIFQEGKYKIIGAAGDKITLELDEQKGTFGAKKRTVEIIAGYEKENLMISGTPDFSRVTAGTKNNE